MLHLPMRARLFPDGPQTGISCINRHSMVFRERHGLQVFMVFMVYMVFRHCMIFQLRKTDWWKGTSWTRMRRREKDLSLSVETKWVGDSKCFKLIWIPPFLLLIPKQIQHFLQFLIKITGIKIFVSIYTSIIPNW